MILRPSISRRALLQGAAALAAAPAFAQSAWPDRNIRLDRALSRRRLDRRSVPYPCREDEGKTRSVVHRREPPGASGNTGIDAGRKERAGWLHDRRRHRRPFRNQSVPVRAHAVRCGTRARRADAGLRVSERAVVAAKHVQAKTLQEFIAWAKAQPKGITIGSPGPGTTPHLSGVLFSARTGVNAVHVPFKGASETIPAMLSGDVNFAVDNLASYVSQIESGNMRALAVTSAQRWPTLPNVPTMAEAGVKDFVVTSWSAYVLPRHAARDRRSHLRSPQGDRRRRSDAEALPRGGRALLSSTPAEAWPSLQKSARSGRRSSSCRGCSHSS